MMKKKAKKKVVAKNRKQTSAHKGSASSKKTAAGRIGKSKPKPVRKHKPAAHVHAAVRKADKKKVATKKASVSPKKPVEIKPVAKKPIRRVIIVPSKATLAAGKPSEGRLSRAKMKEYRQLLQGLRDMVVDNINALAGDNLNRSSREASGDLSNYSVHMADHGTDNFDREFALNLVSAGQDSLYDIDDALRRIEDGTYGFCQECACGIGETRLKARPFAKLCIRCQTAAEKGKTRYRPFGQPLIQMGSENGAS